MKVTISSKVENDKLCKNIMALNRIIQEFNGMDITITIAKQRKSRSNKQNRYYRGVVVKLIQSAFKDNWGESYTSDEVHEFLKARFNYIEHVNEDGGEIIKLGKSTTKNSTVEQEEYQEKCRTFGLEWFGITIPLPNEQIEIEL